MSTVVLIILALTAGIVFGLIARKLSMSWVTAGGGGFLAAVFALIALSSSPATDPQQAEKTASPAVASQPTSAAIQPSSQQTTSQHQVHQTAQVDPALQQRCIQQAKTQGYRSGQCAFTFIDTCIKTQSRKEMEAVLRVDAMLGMGDALSCPNMASTFVGEFDKF